MTEHERSLALAAAALDFPLTGAEAAALDRHLVACGTCAMTVVAMRDDASRLAAIERVPAPPHVRNAVLRAALGRRGSASRDAAVSRGAGLRWSMAAAVLALLALGGTLVAGAVMERLREERPVPTDPTRLVTNWRDLGILDEVEGRTIVTILPRPRGGLVALGRDQRSALPVVWVSDDGVSWTETEQPDDVFGGRVPTTGALHGGALWVVGWDISVAGAQRAMWSSADGETWARAGGSGGLLGTEASGLQLAAGPAGLLVWATDGRTWASVDGATWVRSDAGVTGITDAAVDDSRSWVVGAAQGRAFVASSGDGIAWSGAATRAAAADATVGMERDASGVLLAWVGDRAFEVTPDGWRDRGDAPQMPQVAEPRDIVGGDGWFAAIGEPTSQGAQRAWVGDGVHDWQAVRSEPSSGARTVIGVAAVDDAWFVVTRQGTRYRSWSLVP